MVEVLKIGRAESFPGSLLDLSRLPRATALVWVVPGPSCPCPLLPPLPADSCPIASAVIPRGRNSTPKQGAKHFT